MANEISCLKFEKTWANEHFERHNFRVVSPEYLLKNHAHENEYRTIFDPRSEYEKIDFSNKRGRKIEYAHSIREAVLLVKDGTTIKDIESAVKKIEDTLEIKCCSIAIHNDEGHVDKDSGQTIYNTHAHLVFYTLDKDGKQNFRLTKIRPKLSKLQQDLADELHMIKPKVNSKRKGLSHAEFREVQEQLEQEKNKQKDLDKKKIEKLTQDKTVLSNNLSDIATELEVPKDENNKFKLQDIKNKVKALNADNKLRKKDISSVCEMVRKASIGTGVPREFYRELSAIKKGDVNEVQELQQALITLLGKYESSLKNKDNEISDLKDKNTELSNQEPKEIIKTVEVIKEVPKEITKTVEVVKEVPRELTADEIKKTETYKNLALLDAKIFNEVKGIGEEISLTFNMGDDLLTYIKSVKDKVHNTVLSNSQKPKEIVKTVEVVKEVSREITTSEVEKHPRFLALELEKDNLVKYYENLLKPDMSNLTFNFLTVGDFENLKPRDTEKTNFLGRPIKETPAQVIERFNKVLERRNEDVKLNYQKIKHKNTVLSNENNELKAENEELKSWKKIGIDLLHNFGFYIGEKLPSIEEVKSTVKSFTSRLFSAFMMNNDHDLNYVQNKIVDGQEYKQAQIEKQQQKEQAKQQEQIEQQVDQALGFGATTKTHKVNDDHEIGGRGRG